MYTPKQLIEKARPLLIKPRPGTFEEYQAMVDSYSIITDLVHALEDAVNENTVLKDRCDLGRYLEANAEERLKAIIIYPVMEENKILSESVSKLKKMILDILKIIETHGGPTIKGHAVVLMEAFIEATKQS